MSTPSTMTRLVISKLPRMPMGAAPAGAIESSVMVPSWSEATARYRRCALQRGIAAGLGSEPWRYWGIAAAGAARLSEIDHSLAQAQRDAGEVFAGTGSGDAMAIANAKQGAVGCADCVLAGQIQELALHPIQRPAGMGAGIDIAADLHAPAHDEDRSIGALESLAAGIGNLVQPAERFQGRRNHAFVCP